MQLVIITSENDIADETNTVNALFAAGLAKLHLRKPSYSYAQYKHYLHNIAPQYHPKVIIHGAWDLYHDQMAGGVHLRSALRDTEEAREVQNTIPHSAISTSCHSWQEVIDLGSDYGSIFISPLFDSISKPGYTANVAPEGIIQTKAAFAEQDTPCPQIIGLGGINIGNINTLKMLGYDGAALLGAIWTPYPIEAFEAIKQEIT